MIIVLFCPLFAGVLLTHALKDEVNGNYALVDNTTEKWSHKKCKYKRKNEKTKSELLHLLDSFL